MKAKGSGQSSLLLLDVIIVLDKLDIPYAIVGAMAASFYGVVRASMDADAVISVDESQPHVKDLLSECKKRRWKVIHRRGDEADPIGAVINIQDHYNNRVDLLIGIRGMKPDVFSRARVSSFLGSQIRIIAIEDFIAMKIFAGGQLDIQDVIGVFKVSGEKIDRVLLKKAVAHYGKKASAALNSLLHDFL